jgi:hypothetical protein
MRKFGRWIYNLGIEKHIEIICDSGNEINKSEGVKLRNAGYNIIFAKRELGSISSGIETMQRVRYIYQKNLLTSSRIAVQLENLARYSNGRTENGDDLFFRRNVSM